MRTVALLLDDAANRYQQLLVQQAQAHAPQHGVTLLPPEFAGGSPWAQVESVNKLMRGKAHPDGVMAMLAGGQAARVTFERLAKAAVPLVLLNRVADWIAELRALYPHALVAAVAPKQ